MADPFVVVALAARSKGLDLSHLDLESAVGRLRVHLLMDMTRRELEARILETQLRAQPGSEQLFERYVQLVLPSQAADDLDLMARWYIMERPDLLREQGLEIDG